MTHLTKAEILELSDVSQVSTYISFHPNTKEKTLLSAVHATFSKVDHILEHKADLNKGFQKIKDQNNPLHPI